MEQIVVWVAVATGAIFPFIGWIFRNLIARDINEIRDKQKEDRELFFKRLDENRVDVKDNYVRKELYTQAMQYHSEKNDAEFKSLLSIVNTQFNNIETKLKNTDDKIDDLKQFLNDKLNGHK